MTWVRRIGAGLVVLLALLAATVYLLTFHPDEVQAEPVTCPADTPVLTPGQPVSVMSWNVQYMAGKDYVFFYDLLDESGPDERPTAESITETIEDVARIIIEEDPDLLLLQEVDEGADRTDGEDQLERLLGLLPPEYSCHASAFYWQAGFVPHPRIMGAVGMKLSTVSRYQISSATRHALPLIPADPVTQQFGLKRAILEARLPVEGGPDLVAFNTHLDAFAQGSDTMQQQVAIASDLMARAEAVGEPWLMGGDFNLLPPGPQYAELDAREQAYYQQDSELAVLTEQYPVVPSVDEANGPDAGAWFTHLPNASEEDEPDRTIDFVFHSTSLALGPHEVRAGDALTVSDHLPVLLELTLP